MGITGRAADSQRRGQVSKLAWRMGRLPIERGLFRPRLVVMVKQPVGGRVKTRLARQAGLARAVNFYRHSTAAVLARIAYDRRWQTLLSVAPDTATASPAWPASVTRIAQGGGDLGERMQRIFDALPPGPVIVVGSDIPGITADKIAAAFRLLGAHDAVFGPASDGGYWLVGMRRRQRIPKAFAQVRWSTADTLRDTKANLTGWRIADAAVLDDVDDLGDMARTSGTYGRRIPTLGAKCPESEVRHDLLRAQGELRIRQGH